MTNANYLIAGLIGLNSVLAGLSAWWLKRFIDKNDEHHDEFYTRTDALKLDLAVLQSEHKHNHPAG